MRGGQKQRNARKLKFLRLLIRIFVLVNHFFCFLIFSNSGVVACLYFYFLFLLFKFLG
uniref:Uncharacterized protein n=1 Tax=Rhizophora mucronata TaxID=61149 RepID=A0A2P2Q7T9_RHIMU